MKLTKDAETSIKLDVDEETLKAWGERGKSERMFCPGHLVYIFCVLTVLDSNWDSQILHDMYGLWLHCETLHTQRQDIDHRANVGQIKMHSMFQRKMKIRRHI